MPTNLERLAVLETEVRHIRGTLDEVRATQLEIRDTVVSTRGGWAALKGGAGLLRVLYPPAAAAIAVLGAHFLGLPRV